MKKNTYTVGNYRLRTTNYQPGFTLIELLIVVGLMLLLGAALVPVGTSVLVRNRLDTTVDQIVGSLRKAQQYAINEKAGATWGVCVSSDNQIRLYRGDCDTPTIAENFSIPASVEVSGLGDITFSGQRGEPSSSLTISLSTSLEDVTITLNRAGGVSVN